MGYTTDRTIQILISLLKQHHIRKVVASPGTTNAVFVASLQNDPFFEMYSSVDERSAAYIACGLSQESGEPVVITCTEATASRNYLPALTEAYYRKLPILAITGYHSLESVGQLYPQSIDRSTPPSDSVRLSVNVKNICCSKDEWYVNYQINKAILELKRNGGGPVHINLQSSSKWMLSSDTLPKTRMIRRIKYFEDKPTLPKGRIAVLVGIHHRFSEELQKSLEDFCKNHNAVVFADNISGYCGKYRINPAIVVSQKYYKSSILEADLAIHIGETGAPAIMAKECWRVSNDGEIRDSFKKLTFLFDMEEIDFFQHYSEENCCPNDYYQTCLEELSSISSALPEFPFSNVWIAYYTSSKIPSNSYIHFGILNSYRSWNFFQLPEKVYGHCNVGGYGIDGGLSTLIGSSLSSKSKIHFGVFGDLAFFYDMNSLGNRHIGNNLRIILINNGKGQEFMNHIHPASQLGEMGNYYVAAAGHYGNKSDFFVKHYVEDLGFDYIRITSKEEYVANIDRFTDPLIGDKSIIMEVFTNGEEESKALDMMTEVKKTYKSQITNTLKDTIYKVIGDEGLTLIKKVIK